MQSQVKKWGNSAAIRIPANVLHDVGLSIHSIVTIDVIDDQIVIKAPNEKKQRIRLPFTETELLQNLDGYTAHADELASLLPSETDSH